MISIIGAGPSGSYLAYLLAKGGKEVNVFEEHNEIGVPVQCTGLVTNTITKLIDIKDEFLVNKIENVEVIAPNGEKAFFKLKKSDFVFDRNKFDKYISEMAIREGVKYYVGKKFTGFKDNYVILNKNERFKTDFLVGADGPLSSVAKHFNMYKNRKFMLGLQARVKGKFKKDTFVVYLGKGYFGWNVPESSEFSRVGVIGVNKNSKKYFDDVLRKVNGEIIEYQSGLIPVFQPKIKCQKNNVFLLGDAATQAKGSTHGGIFQGMTAAKALSEAIIKGKNYDLLWRKELGKDLYFHLKIREKLDKFTDEDLNYLVKLTKKEKVKEILENYERDFASKIVIKALLKEPRFLKFLFI